MAWGEVKCMFCDEIINGDGTSNCECRSRVTYRNEPEAPTSAMRFYYTEGPAHPCWTDALEAFERLSNEDRRHWEEKALADRTRYEREKMDYNDNLQLDEEILTDKEVENGMECENDHAYLRRAMQRRRCEQNWARYRRDHKKFKSLETVSRGNAVPTSFHRFRDLPPEIRIQIYNHVFNVWRTTKCLRHWQLVYESEDRDFDVRLTNLPLDTRILTVNREIYAEALEVLYSSRCFTVDIHRTSVPPLFVQKATGSLPPRPTSKIRRWHVRLIFSHISHKDSITPQLELVRDVIKDCICLEEVRFSWFSVPHGWIRLPKLTRAYNGMLSMFKDVRGVKNVVFTESFDDDEREDMHLLLGGRGNIHLASHNVRQEVKASMESLKTVES
ncbi:MAG: hypothetical protein Q9213_001614 [Squamulea squamosa]